MVLAVLIDGDGRPVCSEMLAGQHRRRDDTDPVIDRLRRRFDIGRVCMVADRGMISAEIMAELDLTQGGRQRPRRRAPRGWLGVAAPSG
jgi:hypothetical protein